MINTGLFPGDKLYKFKQEKGIKGRQFLFYIVLYCMTVFASLLVCKMLTGIGEGPPIRIIYRIYAKIILVKSIFGQHYCL